MTVYTLNESQGRGAGLFTGVHAGHVACLLVLWSEKKESVDPVG